MCANNHWVANYNMSEADILLRIAFVYCLFIYMYLIIVERYNYKTKSKKSEGTNINNMFNNHQLRYDDMYIKYHILTSKYEYR